MRRQKIYAVMGMLAFLLLNACSLHEEDDIFDDSSANRISAALEEYKKILIAPENGWIMRYYPGSGQALGGYNLLVSFDEKGNATVASELYASEETATSLYSLKQSVGPVLTFDSYNEIMHFFSEPLNGLGGDFEFTIMSATAEKVVLSGTKSRNLITLTPMPKDRLWSDYLQLVGEVQENIFMGSFHVVVNGKEIGSVMQTNNVFTLTYSEPAGENATEKVPFIYTDEGIELYQPLTIDGATMSTFKADVENVAYVCTNEGVNAKFEVFYPEGYRTYNELVGTYKMGTKTVNVTANPDGKTYSLAGFANNASIPVQAEYARGMGTLSITNQYLGRYSSYYVYLCLFNGTYLTWMDGAGLTGVNSVEGPLKITLKDNGVWGSNIGDRFIVYAFSGQPPTNSNALGYLDNAFPAPLVLEKQDE